MSGWAYESHPNIATVQDRTEELVVSSAENALCAISYLLDTRPRHSYMFALVVSDMEREFAGNYRGSPYSYLVNYNVSVNRPGEAPAAHTRGTHSASVAATMSQYHATLAETLSRLREMLGASNRSGSDKLVAVANFVGIFFASFLAIHPYANGNGHISRLIVRSMFNALGLVCRDWQVASRNQMPSDELVSRFRQGDRGPLILAFFNMLQAEATPLH